MLPGGFLPNTTHQENDLSQEPDIKTILEHVEAVENVNQDLVKNLLERISTLEVLNDRLISTLKSCFGLLSQFKSAVPNQEQWQELLNSFEFELEVAESVQRNRIFDVLSPVDQNE
jgi:hypothetical protein